MRTRPAILAALLMLTACGGGGSGSGSSSDAAPPPAVQHHDLKVDGLSRSYRLYVPLSVDRTTPAPLVIMLAGVGNTGESLVEATRFDRVAEREGLVVAYPEGVNQTWNAGYCCLGRATSGPDDVHFLSQLIDDVAAHDRIDTARVYAVGVSAGAMMAYKLACEQSGRIAGVGSVAGAMVLDACTPAQPVSVIEIHGTADDLVPYGGGKTAGGATQPSPPTVAVAQRWAQLDRCPGQPATTSQGVVSTSTWAGCASGTGVELVTIDGGGHTWYADGLGPVSGAVDATDQIWTFLSSSRRSG